MMIIIIITPILTPPAFTNLGSVGLGALGHGGSLERETSDGGGERGYQSPRTDVWSHPTPVTLERAAPAPNGIFAATLNLPSGCVLHRMEHAHTNRF
jgi:hypothetical protein